MVDKLQVKKMKLRPMLLVFVVVASGLMLSVHLVLVSNRAQNYIRVALEIPVEKDGRHTNVELNIQSVMETKRNIIRDTETNSQPTEVSKVIQDRQWRGIVKKEEEEVLENEDEQYEVLLDTGEYELLEKDMDQDIDIELPPPILRHHKHHFYRKKKRLNLKPTIPTLHNAVTLNTNTPTSEAVSFSTKRTNVGSNSSNGDVKKLNEPYVMSKKQYYSIRQMASTQSPQTHTPHHHIPRNYSSQISTCSQPPCLQYLTSTERFIFNKCQKRTVTKKSKESVPGCQCKFRKRVGKKNIAVVSLPGSGNTWVRGLLEKASGLCTGSSL